MFGWLKRFRKRSPWILHYNAGSCNGCDIEILSLLSPAYDLERFGVLNRGNPKQSDILLVTGPVTKRARERVVELYAQMPEPKVVVSVGSCTCTGGVFRGMYHCEDGLDRYLPVDVYIPGCAARPEQMIDGIVEATKILEQKNKAIQKPFRLFGRLTEEKNQTDRREMAATVEAPHDQH